MTQQTGTSESKPASAAFSVNSVRALAIVMVVLVHSSGFPYKIPGEITPLITLNWFTADFYGAIGYLGVPLFVMLSGLLLLTPDKADEPLGVFYRKRFNRVGIPLIFWTLLFFVWSFGVHDLPFTLHNVSQGLLSGSYPLLWFLYMIVGLYLLTPILRVLVKHLDRKKFSILMLLWIASSVSVPIIHTFTSFQFHPVMFLSADWAGYYLLGIYLVDSKIRSSRAVLLGVLGFLVAIFGSWYVTTLLGESYTGFFHSYLSLNMIVASAALFLILIRIPKERLECSNRTLNRLIHWIGENTLPIYLTHILILEALQLELLGFAWPYTGISMLDVPILTVVTLTSTALIIYGVKKIPYAAKLIG
jgi:surface polysaccharide O-acyltransferase-like enzyme